MLPPGMALNRFHTTSQIYHEDGCRHDRGKRKRDGHLVE